MLAKNSNAQMIPMEPIELDNDSERSSPTAFSEAGIDLCWTCGACDNGCPVSIATGRLSPQRNVRMAVYGLLDRLIDLPDIWYCLSCRRCLQGCPNRVKPYELHQYLRDEALRRGIIAAEFIAAYRNLFAEFQRVRWRAAAHCLNGELEQLPDETWYQWLKRPLRKALYHPVMLGDHTLPQPPAPEGLHSGHGCLTCSECSSCCPIFCGGDVFDPQRIIRMANLGLTNDLLRSPAIWLCLGCQRCIEACSQSVSGYAIIRRLQMLAIEKGFVDPLLPVRLLDADRIIYPRFLDEIDALVGLYRMK